MFIIYTNLVKTNKSDSSQGGLLSTASFPSKSIGGHEFMFVQTRLGSLKGAKFKELGGIVYKFLGVPYAMKPLGDLRYKRPVPVRPWTGVHDATNFSKQCVQDFDNLVNVSEDCLYLNIWTPIVTQAENKLKPVMIWIHEGEFIDGTASKDSLDGSILALFGDVVVVTFNYRLGVFGFFDLNVVDAPGNQGLYDQAMAFQWVKDNIRSFGGNPNLVTLFGQSSGSIAIGLHLVSPISKYLFKRVIMQSGSPMVFQSYFANAKRVALRLSEILSCYEPRHKTEPPENIVKCMRDKTVDELLEAQKQLLSEREYAFSPSAKESFLPETPVNIILNKDKLTGFESAQEFLIGVANDEGSVFVNFIMPELHKKKRITSDEIETLLINNSKKLLIPENKAKLLAETFLQNSPEVESSEYWFKVLSDIVGDLFITCPSMSFADEMIKMNKSVYFYVFNHRSIAIDDESYFGVSHGSDIPFVFGLPLKYPAKFTGTDIEVSKVLIHTWSQFAANGKMPTDLKPNWKQYTLRKRDYLEIKGSALRMKQRFHEKNCAVFRRRYEEFKNQTKPRTVSVKVGWTFADAGNNNNHDNNEDNS